MTNVSKLSEEAQSLNGTATTAAGRDDWLTARGLDVEIASRYGVRDCGAHIEFNYVVNGQVVNRKYRGKADKRFWQDGGEQVLWNGDVLDDSTLDCEPLIITEGELDALAAIQAGYPRTVSVPNGANNLGWFEGVEAKLNKCERVIIAADSDDAGANLLHELTIRLGRARCQWLRYPQNCKDLGDALQLHGDRGVIATIKRASWMDVSGIYKMSELPPVPLPVKYSMGVIPVNMRSGDFSVITGVPSHGKSTFLNDALCRIHEKYKVRIAIASFEQKPQVDHKRALLRWGAETGRSLAENEEWLDEAFRFIVPENFETADLSWFMDRAAASVLRHDCKIVVVDPWNELDHLRPHGMSLTEYVGEAIKTFRSFADKYRVHVCVVAHPAKMYRNKDGSVPIPSLYDISDSAHWYNKCDLGIVVHRGEDGTVLRVAKSRYHDEIGKPEDYDLHFSPHSNRYMIADKE